MASSQSPPRPRIHPCDDPVPQVNNSSSMNNADDDDEDLMSAAPNLWLPRSVVKRHRKRATIIWTSMLVLFFAYIVYIIMDTVDSRRDPAASMEIKQEYFKFPDVAICVNQYQGCLTNPSLCFDPDLSWMTMASQYGFLEDELELDDNSLEIEATYTNCKVLPLSKLTVNETGIENGDITSFYVSVLGIWYEDPTLTVTDATNVQFVSVFFIDVDNIDGVGETIIDGKIPYGKDLWVAGDELTLVRSHSMITMTEFQGISAGGSKKETERTYEQRTTSADFVFTVSADDDVSGSSTSSAGSEFAILWMDFAIGKFEYTRVIEVDPVDGWAIIGAIGGVWQIVCVGFGMFFVFSVKQAPDRKMRNWEKTVKKPIDLVSRRMSISSRTSNTSVQDKIVDASEEDLPEGWLKKERRNGTQYYVHTLTGSVHDRSPNELSGQLPPTNAGSAGVFTPAHNPGLSPSYGSNSSEMLPPGWIMKTTENGRPYYVDTILKTTQWDRPQQHDPTMSRTGHLHLPSTSSSHHQPVVVDAPMQHSRRSSARSSGSTQSNRNSSSQEARPLPPPHPAAAAAAAVPAPAHASNGTATVGGSGGLWPRRTENEVITSNSGGGGGGGGGGGIPAPTNRPTSVPNAGGTSGARRLPPSWKQQTTKEGKTFYVNHELKKTQWEFPS